MAVKASNQITIIDVVDAYSIMMTSESYTFAGSTTGAESGATCSTGIVAFCGSTQCSNVTVGTVSCPTGISAVVTDNNSSFVTVTFTVTATISNSCEAVIPVSVDSVTVNKKMSFAVALSGADGVDGSSGSDGVGISETEVAYATGTSATSAPSSGWSSSVQETTEGEYLWTRTKTTYTNGEYTTSYSVAAHGATGEDGKDGSDGADGSDGVGISSTTVNYATGTSATSAPSSGWSNSVLATADGEYLWTRTIITYTNGETSTSYSVAAHGTAGEDGKDGSDGVGISGSVVEYATSTSATTAPEDNWSTTIKSTTEGQYLWTRVITNFTDGGYATSYSVAAHGATGTAGKDGSDGSDGVGISSTSITYAVSTSATTAPSSWSSSVQATSTGQYLWTRTIITYTSGGTSTSYSVAAHGATGRGVSSIKNYYQASSASSGVTSSTGTWSTTVPTLDATNKFLWNYEVTIFTDGDEDSTTPTIIGVYGEDGRSIASVTEEYALSTSNSTVTGTWSTTVPTITSTNKYLWNRELITYSDGTNDGYTTAIVIGVYGDKGEKGDAGEDGKDGVDGVDGVGISSTTVTYGLSTSATTAPSSWSSSVQVTSTGQYLWTRTIITYTSGGTSTSYSVAAHGATGTAGKDGSDGSDGVGISSTSITYAVSTSATTAPSSWSSSVQATSTGQYLWTRTIITYTSGNTSTSYSVAAHGATGSDGKDGADGADGDDGRGLVDVTNWYLVTSASSGVTTSTSGWSSTPMTVTVDAPYLWNYEVLTWDADPPTSETTPTIVGQHPSVDMEIGSRNYLRNGNFASTYLENSTNTLITDGIYAPYRWVCYNVGITNVDNYYQAHIDTETFGFPVIEFNETNGLRTWKGLHTNFYPESSGVTYWHGPIDITKTYRLSLDVYATGTGTKVHAGFYYYIDSDLTTRRFYTGDSTSTSTTNYYKYITSDQISVGEWSRVSVELYPFREDTYTEKCITLYIYGYSFSSNEILYIKDVSLNVSDVTTAWTPAIEDEEENLSEVKDDIVSYYEISNAQLTTEIDNITAMVESTYVTQNDYNTFVEETSSVVEQTAEDVSMIFTQTTANTSNLNTLSVEVESQFSEINKYITFGTSGITISSNNSAIQLVVDNSGIIFSNNGVTIGSWDGTDFYTGNIWVEVDEYARFGNYAFLPQSDGSLKFMKVGD